MSSVTILSPVSYLELYSHFVATIAQVVLAVELMTLLIMKSAWIDNCTTGRRSPRVAQYSSNIPWRLRWPHYLPLHTTSCAIKYSGLLWEINTNDSGVKLFRNTWWKAQLEFLFQNVLQFLGKAGCSVQFSRCQMAIIWFDDSLHQ